MSEIKQILLTSSLTIVGGVIILAAGQLISEFLIKPYIRYKKIIGEIDEELIFYSNVYTNPGSVKIAPTMLAPIYKTASYRMRRLASKFGAVYRSLGLKKLLIKWNMVISDADKDKIEGNLIFLSNSLRDDFVKENLEKSSEIREILKI